MIYANGKAAVPIIAAIDQATAQTALIGSFTTANAQIVSISWTHLDGTQYGCQVQLSVAESATIFNTLFAVWNNRLQAANTQLAGLAG